MLPAGMATGSTTKWAISSLDIGVGTLYIKHHPPEAHAGQHVC